MTKKQNKTSQTSATPTVEDISVSDVDEKRLDDYETLPSRLVYEIIRREGVEQLDRPAWALWWSAVSAGIAISMSLVAEAALRSYLPETTFRPLIENFGYTVGFILVVLGRMALLTENTMTPILPILVRPSPGGFRRLARLWTLVLSGNFAGTFVAACTLVYTTMYNSELVDAAREISLHYTERAPADAFITAVPAGFLIAALVWILADAHASRIWLIVVMTYVIALIDSSHIIVGSTEAFMIWLEGSLPTVDLVTLLASTLAGNLVGGTGLFALLVYAGVRHDIAHESKAGS